jgi:hypothetical protein
MLAAKKCLWRPTSCVLGRLLKLSVYLAFIVQLASAQQVTVGSIVHSVGPLSQTLETLAIASLENAQTSKGYQQLLLAQTLQATTTRLSDAYSKDLNRPLRSLDEAQFESLTHFATLLNELGDINEQTQSKTSELVDRTLAVVHSVFDVLPTTNKPPVIFGVALPGVFTSNLQDPNDIVIYGYHLADSKEGSRKPEVSISGITLPPDAVTADFGKISIHLPLNLKRTIGYANTPCDPLKSFKVSLRVFYEAGYVTGLVHWATDDQFSLSVPVPTQHYDLDVQASGIATVRTPQVLAFNNSSRYVSVDCEQTAVTSVNWQAPENARISDAHAEWVEVNNVTSQTQNVVIVGASTTATGSIRGLNKQCAIFSICNCPGGGHGQLRVFGTYTLDDPGLRSFTARQTLRGGSSVQFKLPSPDTWTLNHLIIRVTKTNCATELDRFEVDSNTTSTRQLTSVRGLFMGQIVGGVITVRAGQAGSLQ